MSKEVLFGCCQDDYENCIVQSDLRSALRILLVERPIIYSFFMFIFLGFKE